MRNSKTKLQTLQANKEVLEIFAGNMEKDAHNSLAELQRLQLEHQVLKSEKDNLQVSYETLSAEKVAVLEGQNASLTTSLKDASEQKTDVQPLKEHALAQRRRIHQL